MQGGDGGEAETQHNNRLEGIDESTLPTLASENEIDMQEEDTGAGRGQSEGVENEIDMQERSKAGKIRVCRKPVHRQIEKERRYKRGLRDITPVSYEEYEDSWDLEDQSKKVKRAANCLLASCECNGESESGTREETCRYIYPQTRLQSWAGRPGP